jgi:hypothetical protein
MNRQFRRVPPNEALQPTVLALHAQPAAELGRLGSYGNFDYGLDDHAWNR